MKKPSVAKSQGRRREGLCGRSFAGDPGGAGDPVGVSLEVTGCGMRGPGFCGIPGVKPGEDLRVLQDGALPEGRLSHSPY